MAGPLIEAAGEGHVETVRLLLAAGANKNKVSSDGKTALSLLPPEATRRSSSCSSKQVRNPEGHISVRDRHLHSFFNFIAIIISTH